MFRYIITIANAMFVNMSRNGKSAAALAAMMADAVVIPLPA